MCNPGEAARDDGARFVPPLRGLSYPGIDIIHPLNKLRYRGKESHCKTILLPILTHYGDEILLKILHFQL